MAYSKCDKHKKERHFFVYAGCMHFSISLNLIQFEREQVQPTRMSNSFELNPISVTRFWMAKSTIITISILLSRLLLLLWLLFYERKPCLFSIYSEAAHVLVHFRTSETLPIVGCCCWKWALIKNGRLHLFDIMILWVRPFHKRNNSSQSGP